MNPHIVIFFTCLDEQDLLCRVLAQAIGQHAAGATSADDDVVVILGGSH